MSYRIRMFDTLVLPEERQRDDTQNMGTGSAMTSFSRLPGGGFYDNYGDRRRPQNIRPITKECLITGSTEADMLTNLDALRAKLGERGKLTVEYGDGSLRWQWAILTDVDTPRRWVGPILPCRLRFVTAAQHWYGIDNSLEEWTWGDLSWVFGDGTASFGGYLETETITSNAQTVSVTHSGNIRARNLFIRITEGATANGTLTITNQTTRQALVCTTARGANDIVIFNMADLSAWHYDVSTEQTATQITSSLGYILVFTGAAHGLTVGDYAYVDGSSNFDGVHRVAIVTDTTTWGYVPTEAERAYATETAAGMVSGRAFDIYDDCTIYDKAHWIGLAPGSNSILFSAGSFVSSYTVDIAYYDHYA